ncbi:peroxidase, FMP-type [Oceanobacter mangrovi]|uniref:peroxidase, FMP-type n=1 Tax=Oceanobacter mangrovi TaxID=2862510 RepID=UPI001C8DC138|nr:peroxidase, FMP-type [Oceanobacter mangrovi]
MSDNYPRYTPDVLEQPADYGVLAQLAGTWVNVNPDNTTAGWGIHTTCMPSPGSNSETLPGKFHFLCENYTEELTFTLVPGGVRNRGGTNEQFCGAVQYEQQIKDLNGGLLHVENGMYLWLSDVYNHPADDDSIMEDIGFPEMRSGDGSNGPQYVPNYQVSRSGTIPHGSTVLLFGKQSGPTTGAPEFPTGDATWDPAHLAISDSMGGAGASPSNPINLDQPAPAWVDDKSLPDTDPSGNRTYTQRILAHELYPYSVRPDLKLRDVLSSQNVKSYTLLTMATEQTGGAQGGVLNTPFVQRFTPIREMQFRLWIETIEENGEEILQLQYEQIQFFEFQFGTDGGTTRWPHIQVNTLRKKA